MAHNLVSRLADVIEFGESLARTSLMFTQKQMRVAGEAHDAAITRYYSTCDYLGKPREINHVSQAAVASELAKRKHRDQVHAQRRVARRFKQQQLALAN